MPYMFPNVVGKTHLLFMGDLFCPKDVLSQQFPNCTCAEMI